MVRVLTLSDLEAELREEKVLSSIDSGVAVVTLNRPESRNALDTDILDQLRGVLLGITSSSEVRACVLTGMGPAFCAGADLKQRSNMTPREQEAHTISIRECADLLENLPVPVIAAVNGATMAGGLELAIACDFRIASERASFGFPEVRLGIFPGAGGPVRLPRLIGSGWARLMVFGGDPIAAGEALRIGLVERVVLHEELMDEVLALARVIAGHPARAVRAVKELMNRSATLRYDEAVSLSDSLRAPLNAGARWKSGLAKRKER